MSGEGNLMAENPQFDLEIAEIMADELEDYIVGNELYRTVIAKTSAGNKSLNMSGGDFLARLERLHGEYNLLSADEAARISEVQKRADAIIYSMLSRFNERLNRELKARLDALRYFMKECEEDRRRCRVEYPFEMRNRQRIEVILMALGEEASPALVGSLDQVDTRLMQLTKESPFVWDTRLQSVYPPEPYWYLYRRP